MPTLELDDYHLIKAYPVHDALAFLLDHLPPQLHLVIAIRGDPPLPIVRLRGRGQLNELRLANLRFTLDEATEFLNRYGLESLKAGDDHPHSLTARWRNWTARPE